MVDVIAGAVVELARVAVAAYVVRYAGEVALLYVQRLPKAQTTEDVIDAARARGVEVQA